MHNHYTVHCPQGSVLGFSLKGLRYIIDKDVGSVINYLSVQEYQAKYPSLPVTKYSDIIEDYQKIEKFKNRVYKMQNRNGRLLLYKELKYPFDILGQRKEIECLSLLSKSTHVITFREVVVSQMSYLMDLRRVSGLMIRGFLIDYAIRGSLSRVLDEEPECEWNQ